MAFNAHSKTCNRGVYEIYDTMYELEHATQHDRSTKRGPNY